MAVGRPTKLTPDLQAAVCRHLASGCYVCTACELVGISEKTLSNWKQRGADGEEPFVSFVQALKEAEAKAEERAVLLVQAAMPNDWKAAMTWLERKFPDRWSRNEKREIMGKGGGPVQVATVPVFNDADPLNHIDKPDTESNGNDSGPDDDTT